MIFNFGAAAVHGSSPLPTGPKGPVDWPRRFGFGGRLNVRSPRESSVRATRDHSPAPYFFCGAGPERAGLEQVPVTR
jgi:hypothetical protein